MWYQKGWATIMYKFFDKKTGSVSNVIEVPTHELQKPKTEKFKRRKIYAGFKKITCRVHL